MSLLSKLFPLVLRPASILLFSALHLTGCRTENKILSPAHYVLIDEPEGALNTDRLNMQMGHDSTVFLQNENKGLYLYNFASGKILEHFSLNDSIRYSVLNQMIKAFPEKHIFRNQDSLVKSKNHDELSIDPIIICSSFNKDSGAVFFGFTYIGHYGAQIHDKTIYGYVYDHFPVLAKTGRNFKIIEYFPLHNNENDRKQLTFFSRAFTCSGNKYYFPSGMTNRMINPGGIQIKTYRESGKRLYPVTAGGFQFPLQEAIVKKMGYTDTTTRNTGNGERLEYRLKTIQNQVYFTNKHELGNIGNGATILDGITNDFTICSFTQDSLQNFYLLTNGNSGYRLKILSRNRIYIHDEEVPIEKGEKVIQSDIHENKLVFIVQKNEKLYFKIFNYVYAEKR